MSIKRYDMNGPDGEWEYYEYPYGKWVLYDDHAVEVERLRAELDEERDRHDRARAEVDVLLPPNPQFYMDPPDGGGVDRVEVVRRYIAELRQQRDEALIELGTVEGVLVVLRRSVLDAVAISALPRAKVAP